MNFSNLLITDSPMIRIVFADAMAYKLAISATMQEVW